MPDPVTLSFSDVVRRIAPRRGEPVYDVIFQRHAAFYSVAADNRPAIEGLTRSAEQASPVDVVCDGATLHILSAVMP